MRRLSQAWYVILLALAMPALTTCNQKKKAPAVAAASVIDLKRGNIILCGPPGKELGRVSFNVSGSGKVQEHFNLAVSLLHSFEYDEAEKVFAQIIDEDPSCAMAYWGVAMSNFHPLWTPPARAELEKGSRAVAIARSLPPPSKMEAAYIAAIASFYEGWEQTDHITRARRFETAMERLYRDYPKDREAAVFYALALNGAADPADTSFSRQRKAGRILDSLYRDAPDHPGVVHYIIHSYDYPALAALALPAARSYASVAPASAHAQHMPSHIFTRLGLWEECIRSNLSATDAARCYAAGAGIKGHWDEELHGLDYLVYAYLQNGQRQQAKAQWDYLSTIHETYPSNFKVAYAFAAIPARYVLENKLWSEAAALKTHPAGFAWAQFPWQQAITHFARLLGNAHTGRTDAARAELKILQALHDTLAARQDNYAANQVQIQINSGEAWILFGEGKQAEALQRMQLAADMEDHTTKHPVTPGEIIPARELLGDMLLRMNRPEAALEAYEADLKARPNRLNGLSGARLAAERANNAEKEGYYKGLLTKRTVSFQ